MGGLTEDCRTEGWVVERRTEGHKDGWLNGGLKDIRMGG